MIGYWNERLEERVALLYTAGGLGRAVSPPVGPGLNSGGESGLKSSDNFFCFCLWNKKKLALRKNENLVLFCATSAADMFTKHRINNSSFFYVFKSKSFFHVIKNKFKTSTMEYCGCEWKNNQKYVFFLFIKRDTKYKKRINKNRNSS